MIKEPTFLTPIGGADKDDSTPKSLIMGNSPKKREYTEGEKFDSTGMTVQLVYPSGRTESTTDFTVTPSGALKTTDTYVTATAKGLSTTCDIIVHAKSTTGSSTYSNPTPTPEPAKEITAIKITKAPNKTTYYDGEAFDKTGMQVMGKESGSSEYNVVVTSFVVAPTRALVMTDSSVTVTSNGLTATQSVTVKAKPESMSTKEITSIKITKAPNKTTYYDGEAFDKTGMQVMGKESGSSAYNVVLSSYKVTPTRALVMTDTSATVTSNGLTAKQPVTVKAKPESMSTKEITAIKIINAPNHTTYFEGEVFDTTGMVVMGKEDGSSEYNVILSSYKVTPSGVLTTSDEFFEIKYKDLVLRQRIMVIAKQDCNCVNEFTCGNACCENSGHHCSGYSDCTHPEDNIALAGIGIFAKPEKTVYYEGEFFDPKGMIVRNIETKQSGLPGFGSINITAYKIVNRGPFTAGVNEVKIQYKDFTAVVNVTAIPKLCVKDEPARISVPLVQGIEGMLDLGTGALITEFEDVKAGDGSFPFAVTHVHKNSCEDHGCGSGWRLNLHCTLKEFDENSPEGKALGQIDARTLYQTDYVYTDAHGTRYSFTDNCYYITEKGGKMIIGNTSVKTDLDGNLFYENTDGKVYKVQRELVSATGHKLSVRLPNVQGAEKIEQRAEEIVKLEKEIAQYESAIAELDYAIWQNKELDKDAHEVPDDIQKYVAFGSDKTVAQRLRNTQNTIEELSVTDDPPEIDLTPDPLLDSDEQEKQKEKLKKQDLKNKKLWAYRKYRVELNNVQTVISAEKEDSRRAELTKQYECQRDAYVLELEQKQALLEKYKVQAPVAYLTDADGRTMCFNEFGNLCGIVDKFGNQITVVWEKIRSYDGSKYAITAVYCGERKTTFEYNANGLLESVTDFNGKSVKYTYGLNDRLVEFMPSDGDRRMFSYNCTYNISSIKSYASADGVAIAYTNNKLLRVQNQTFKGQLTDTTRINSDFNYTTSQMQFKYADGRTTVDDGEKTTVYYINGCGGLAASGTIEEDGTLENCVFTYVFDNKTRSYTVKESGDAIFKSAELVGSSTKQIAEIKKSELPDGVLEFVFGAEAKLTGVALSDTGMPLATSFANVKSTASDVYELRAEVVYKTETVTFCAPFDYKLTRTQYAALPVTVTNSDDLVSIKLYFDCSQSAVADRIRFSPAEWEYKISNMTGTYSTTETSKKPIAVSDGRFTYESISCTRYADESGRVTKDLRSLRKSGKQSGRKVTVTEYSYCDHGNLIKTVSYDQDRVGEKGKTVTERVCDEKGNVVKEFTYNTLDSTTKFYRENEVTENGEVTAELDETGENKTAIEYNDGTSIVKSEKLPNGSTLAYGYDERGNVTGITQSTADGESNSTEIKYTLGSPTRLKSGNNTVFYEYDRKRRITKTTLNGKETTYEYSGEKFDDVEEAFTNAVQIGGVSFNKRKANKTAVTRDGITSETFTDKGGNVTETRINGVLQTAANYDKDGRVTESGDNVTGSVKKYTYSEDMFKTLKSIQVTEGTNTPASTETFAYDDMGRLSQKTIDGKTYSFAYKDAVSNELEKVTVPNGTECFPLTDVNGRNTGKELKDQNGNNVYGEYIYYRKVGDHATNMPSSMYFGMNKNGKYGITENIKYKYDESGNISEVRENGLISAKYTYDKLGRLVREDNKKLNKSIFISYDNNGNILFKRETAFTLKPIDGVEFTKENQYSYDGDRLLSFGDMAIEYDENGKPVMYKGRAMTWNNGRLTAVDETTFTYDGYGRRLTKGNTKYAYDSDNRLIKQTDGTNTLEFTYDSHGLSGVTHNGTEYIYRKDVLGNIVGILDSTGREVVKYMYDAWGGCSSQLVDSECFDLATLNPFRYRGYVFDPETNLYYLNTRYYDPETGRFISQDDVSYLDPEHVNGLNLFAYCGNNPVMRTDSQGTNWWNDFLCTLGAAVLTVIAVGVTVAAAIFTGGIAGTAIMGVAISMGIGAVSGGYSAYRNGTSIAAGILGGIVKGAAVGAAVGLGIVTGGGALSIAGGFLAFGSAVVVNFISGMAQYAIENCLNGRSVDWRDALAHGGMQALSSVFAFGAGAIIGASGFYNMSHVNKMFSKSWIGNIAVSQFIKSLTYYPFSFVFGYLQKSFIKGDG